ncbi:hypothetical protein BU15DRAFT_66078 [Melanogaster broomeanus]|nr:hypothetical protein BU15DRAFT_66078 [Melanogaster broomeanus]
MPFTDADDLYPEPTATSNPSNPPTYSPPTEGNMAAVIATVSIVGALMFVLITWLILRLRRAPSSRVGFSTSPSRRVSNVSDRFRPSFSSTAPSVASSKYGLIRKPLRVAHQCSDGSWDFADPDPYPGSKESPLVSTTSKRRPPPLFTPALPVAPTYSPSPRSKRSSTYKDEFGPRTPSTPGTPGSFELVEPPPPAYCKDGASWPLYQPNDFC